MIYLNQAGTSWPKPEVVHVAASAALRAAPSEWEGAFEASHAKLAGFLGISSRERLLLTPGCTSALGVGIADHAWAAGDRVLVSALEHHALSRPVSLLRERGVEVGVIPRAPDAPLDLDVLAQELARGRVRLVAMTAACNVTGELLPLRDIVELAHEHDALCLLDGAQLCGWMPVDVTELRVDLFTFAGHKALQAPWGIGGLYVAPHVALHSPAAHCDVSDGGDAPRAVPGSVPGCAGMPGYCDVGSVDRAALAGMAAALDWLAAPERADRLEVARAFIEGLTLALEDRPGLRLHGARDPRRRLPTVAFTHAGRSVAEIAQIFERGGVRVGAGLQCAPLAHEALGTAPQGVVRLSAGPFNRADELERVLEIVREI